MLKKYAYFSIAAMVFCCTGIQAQTPDTIWTKTFGGNDHDYAHDIRQTSDGGYIIAGVTSSYGTGWWNIYLVKTDINGDTAWTRFYSAEGPDIAYCVQQTADDGYIVACEGFTNLLKTDEFGDSLWTRDYGMIPQSVRQATDGGYIVGGSIGVEGYEHACLAKTDASGDSVWQRYYVMGEVSSIQSLQQDADGSYIAAGMTHSEAGCWDYFLLKTNSSGDSMWIQIYGRLETADEAYAMSKTEDGGYIITGLYFWTVKTDAIVDTLWTRYYGSGEIGCAHSIQQTSDGGYIIGGYVDPIEGGDGAQFYMVKTNVLGDVIWERAYGTENGWDYGHCVRQTSDGGYIMTGWTDSFGEGGMDIWLLRLSSESPACIYTPGDANGDESANGLDVIYMVSYLKGGPNPPPDRCECPPHGMVYVAADANGSCLFNGLDVTYLVSYLKGSGNVPQACLDCPPDGH